MTSGPAGGVDTDSQAEAALAPAGLALSEEADSAKASVPPQLIVSRSSEGLLLEVRVPTWLRWNRWLALVSGVCFLIAWFPATETWGEYVGTPAFLLLIAVTIVHVATLYFSRIQYVRDEKLLWGADMVTCTRRRGSWCTPVTEIDGVDLMELGKKRSKLPSHSPPTWHEYQVNVTVKDTIVECFRSSDRRLVEWIAVTLQTELKDDPGDP